MSFRELVPITQWVITRSKSTVETLEQDVKHVGG